MELAARMTASVLRPRLDGFGAEVGRLDLTAPVLDGIACAINEVLADHGALKRFSRAPRPFGPNEFIHALPDHPEILEVCRNPEGETAAFGGGWHSDWRFPPRRRR